MAIHVHGSSEDSTLRWVFGFLFGRESYNRQQSEERILRTIERRGLQAVNQVRAAEAVPLRSQRSQQ